MTVLLACAGSSTGARAPETGPPADTAPVLDSAPNDDSEPRDVDGDGFGAIEDCDDADPDVHPGADEIPYDGRDQDCDGIDLDDVDGDGHPGGGGEDCDDGDPSVNPDATDGCGDGRDLDCDPSGPSCPFEGSGPVEDLIVAEASAELVVGISLAYLGDLDGDGDGELAVTGWQGGTYASAAWLLEGPLAGLLDLQDAAGSVDFDVSGPIDYPQSAGAGDTDGDGVGELLLAAPYADPGQAGGAWLFRTPIGGTDTSAATTSFAATAGTALGWRLAGLGDLDGDGLDDVAVSAASGERTTNGEVGVFLGPVPEGRIGLPDSDARITGETALGYLGSALASADLDQDGRPELLVADPGGGAVWMFAAPRGALGPEDATASLVAADGVRPVSVAVLADRDGDGVPEVVVGAGWVPEGDDWVGRVWLNHGPFAGTALLDDAAAVFVDDEFGMSFGARVIAAGDVDGDGLEDLAVGAYDAEVGGSATGGVAVFTELPDGTIDGRSAALRTWATASTLGLGWAMAAGGDLTGDATDDLVLGEGAWVIAGNGP